MGQTAGQIKKWAVYVYMCADVPQPGMKTSSEGALQQMLSNGSSNDLWIAVQIARTDLWTYRYIFDPVLKPGPISLDAAEIFPSFDSASPHVVQEFFRWASKACPAEKIMLVLWGHGYGLDYYVPDEEAQDEARHGFDAEKISQAFSREAVIGANFMANRFVFSGDEAFTIKGIDGSSSIFGPTASSILRAAESANSIPKWGLDAPTGDALLNTQIGEVVRRAAKDLPQGQELAILGFDSCEMALVEVWSEMYETAAYGIASEASLPYKSWPYDKFLRKLLTSAATAEPLDVAEMLTTSFAASYAGVPADYVTLSVCDLGAIKAVNVATAKLVTELKSASRHAWARHQIFTARNYCPEYDTQGYIDFGCFCEFLKMTMPGSEVGKAADATLTAIQACVKFNVFSPNKKEKKISQSTGMSIWIPDWIENPEAEALQKPAGQAYLTAGYSQTKFALDTGWDEFLTLMCARSWGIGALGS